MAGRGWVPLLHELRRQGYAVTVFDKRALPGGLNTYGVAEYKLRPVDSLHAFFRPPRGGRLRATRRDRQPR